MKLFILGELKQFSAEGPKTKTKVTGYLWPITADVNSTTNQS